MAVDVVGGVVGGLVLGRVEVDSRVVGGFGVARASESELRNRATWRETDTAPRPAPDRPGMRATQRRLVAYMVEGVPIAASCIGKLPRAVNGSERFRRGAVRFSSQATVGGAWEAQTPRDPCAAPGCTYFWGQFGP